MYMQVQKLQTELVSDKTTLQDIKRQVADLVEMEGQVSAADAIRRAADLSSISVDDLSPHHNQGSVADILFRNPGTSRQTVEHVMQMRSQMCTIRVGDDVTVLIDKTIGKQISALLMTALSNYTPGIISTTV